VLVSAETARLAGPSIVVRELDTVRVQGHSGALRVYELLPPEDAAGEALARYAAALALYRARDYAAAAEGFDACADQRPDDGPARTMAERCRALLAQPPAADWDGVFEPPGK
jgi:adenylate cyclase